MTTQDSHVCLIGIGMPIENRENGYIAPWEAAEIATDCINEAVQLVVQPAPPSSPSALVCANFKDAFNQILAKRVRGSRVKLGCGEDIPHTRVGF
ncbi:MAG: hypothetical protein ACJ8AT_00810 [Hyalangium sp.]